MQTIMFGTLAEFVEMFGHQIINNYCRKFIIEFSMDTFTERYYHEIYEICKFFGITNPEKVNIRYNDKNDTIEVYHLGYHYSLLKNEDLESCLKKVHDLYVQEELTNCIEYAEGFEGNLVNFYVKSNRYLENQIDYILNEELPSKFM